MFSRPHNNIEYLDIHPGMKVLECGVGAGDYTQHITQRVGDTGGIVYLADIQKRLLQKISTEMIHNNVHTIELLWTDLDTVESLKKIPNESIDRILVANILFQLEHPEHLFQECIRVLKKEGKLLCIDWRESFNHTGPHPQAIVHQDTARHIMTTVGFQVRKDTCDVGPHHYGLLAYK